MSEIYISGSFFNVGVIRDVLKSNTKMSVLIPGIVDGEKPFLLKMGEDYINYTLTTRFIGTFAEINTFEGLLKGYCKELKGAKFRNTGETTSANDIDIVIYDWKVAESNQSCSYREYTITLTEGTIEG